jgi:hypothetical protein
MMHPVLGLYLANSINEERRREAAEHRARVAAKRSAR